MARTAAKALANLAVLTATSAELARQTSCAALGARLLVAPPTERLALVLAALCASAGAQRALRLQREGLVWAAPDLPGRMVPADLSLGIAEWVALQGRPLALFDVGAAEGDVGPGVVATLQALIAYSEGLLAVA